MPIPARPAPLPWITWGKAGASQLIVWHHLVHYGPLVERAERVAPDFVRWLDTQALMAVQVFLVIAGFLATKSLWPRPDAPGVVLSEWPQRVWARYRRLAPPYLAALVVVVLCSALARGLMNDADTPAAPNVAQAVAHALMLQDILNQPALSAGVWYVAMDLQLFALLALLASLVPKKTSLQTGNSTPRLSIAAYIPVILLVSAALTSLCVFNLNRRGDIWAPYFFGAYALGVLAAWGTNKSLPGHKFGSTLLIGALLAIALALQWRDRIALAGLTAIVLLWQPGRWALIRSPINPLMEWLAKISYSVFLIHYPVILAVNALVIRLLPDSTPVHVAGLVMGWLLSLVGGWLLWRGTELHGAKENGVKRDARLSPEALENGQLGGLGRTQ
ncbi:acyltransferase family protein [Ottowia thiooxydans]|uniref:acyltransferase family protein n=1 Tax=Ottowia thiooxydans TaxID=219182 RepID=UPI00041B6491|nr:acyltransferase family protein [Ottowia thiooxydans]